jgi:hypothetical protein
MKLTRQQKMAVAVAKDALKWVGRAKMKKGVYVDGPIPEGGDSGDLKDHAAEVIKNCSMCLKGACLVAKARLYDEVPMHAIIGDETDPADEWGTIDVISADGGYIVNNLSGIFKPGDLLYMEHVFEAWDPDIGDWNPHSEKEQASYRFAKLIGRGRNLKANRARAKAVFMEVVRQKGRFDPVAALEHWRPKLARYRKRKAAARKAARARA